MRALASAAARKSLSARPNSGAGSNAARPSASTSTSRLEPVAVVGGEAGRDRAAERVADQRRRRRAGALDQLAEPREHALGVERAPSATSDAPWPGRSGAITRGSPRGPGSPASSGPRPAGPCSRTTGGPSPPSRTAVETPASCSRRSVTGIPASSRSRRRHCVRPRCACCVAMLVRSVLGRRLGLTDATDGRRPRGIARIHQLARRRAWSFLTTLGLRRGRARRRTRSPRCATTRRAWRRCSAGGGRRCAR